MKQTKEVFAMKKLKKSEMISKDQVLHVRNERQLHADSNTIHGHNDWVVALYYSFQDPNYLYLIMEYVPGLCLSFPQLSLSFFLILRFFLGGDMMTLLIDYDTFSEEVTQFYIAQTICAIYSIHQLDYIHRFICYPSPLFFQTLSNSPTEILNQITCWWTNMATSSWQILGFVQGLNRDVLRSCIKL